MKLLSVLLVLHLLLVCVVGSNFTCSLLEESVPHKNATKTVLNILVTAPYPPSDGGWDGGLAVIPAVRLALRQINENPDILPDYTLRPVEDNSGCQITSTASISFVQNILYSGLKFVGIIGPGCSASTIQLAPILSQPDISMIQIAPTATSPHIETLNKNTTFTMLAPLQMVSNTVDLLKANSWKRFALLYDPSRAIFKTLRNAVVEEASKHKIAVSYDSIVVDDKMNVETYFPFETLKKSRSRVIILLVETRTVQHIMCVAYSMKMVYPIYQWIVPEKTLDGLTEDLKPFIANGVSYDCTREQMMTVLHGSIITTYVLQQNSNQTITPLNIPYHKYRDLFNEEFQCHLNESRIKDLIKNSNKTTKYFIRNDNWENLYYDAAWMYGLALHEVARKGVNLSTYRYGQPNITSAILDEFFKIKFQGASSFIQFTPHRNVFSPIITYNLMSTSASKIQTDFLCLQNRTLSCVVNRSVIQDSFEEVPQRMHLSVGVLIIVCSCGIAIFTAALQTIIVMHSERQSVKAISPNLSHLIFSGCYLYCIATVLFILQQILFFNDNILLYSIFCNVIMWCVVVGASLIFGTILVKVWRVFRIFRHFKNERPGFLLTDQALTLVVILIVIVDIVFCVCWNYMDPYFMRSDPIQVTTSSIDVATIRVNLQCECNNVYLWIGVVLSFKGPIIILVVVFATLNRKIQRKHFSHTKKVNVLVYSLTIVCGAGFPLFFILQELSDSVYVSLIFYFILLLSVVVCCVLLFIPPLLNLDKGKQQSILSQSSRSTLYVTSHHS